jgi:hypothetical protein
MFARKLPIHLKPNTLDAFTKTVEEDIVPLLRKQAGAPLHRDADGNSDVGISAVKQVIAVESAEHRKSCSPVTYAGVCCGLHLFAGERPVSSSVTHSSAISDRAVN